MEDSHSTVTMSGLSTNSSQTLSYYNTSSSLDNTTKGNGSDVDSVHQEPMYQAAVLMIRIVFPTLVALGTVANCLVLLVLRRGAITTGNLSFFLAALAVVDTVFLYSSGAKTWIRAEWGVELLHISTWSCKAGLFVNHLSSSLSAWLVVLVAWQRWYTLSRPFQRCCPVERTRCGHLAFICLVLALALANSYVFITVKLYEESWGKRCAPKEQYKRLMGDVFPYLLMVLYSGLPSLLLILLNCLLARVLYMSRRSLLASGDTTRSSGGSRDAEHVRARYNHVTTMLLALSTSWLVLTAPLTVFKLLEGNHKTPQDKAKFIFLNVLFFVFLYINHSINFFLYCALIRGFRREVRTLSSKVAGVLGGCFRPCRSDCCQRRSRNSSNSVAVNISNHHHRVDGNGNTGSYVPLLYKHARLEQVGHVPQFGCSRT
ncbi:FMRFamide receptor-like [Elysia marginata]|uniref:FMRFamide receptor-like n=1 Tax=Elysia marginata TaxID=1093978 RepID=A0AAV4EFF7_9GAST|nr:FMRFamide receptor-like [Elysia marginata]